jgi:carbonic anhydrase
MAGVMPAITELLRRNLHFAERFERSGLGAEPRLHVAVVTCMDARIDVGAMLGLREAEIHTLRNAGGIVTDDVIRSLTISQSVLGTREVMIVKHTKCGMLQKETDIRRAIEELTGTVPDFPLETFDDLDDAVRASCRRVRESPTIPHRGGVRGFVYDVATGRLRAVSETP